MNSSKQTTGLTQQKPLRLWPGMVIVILQWLVRFGIPALAPGGCSQFYRSNLITKECLIRMHQ